MYVTRQLLNFCHTLTEVVLSPPNTPQNLRIPVKLRPEPRCQLFPSAIPTFFILSASLFCHILTVRSEPHKWFSNKEVTNT